MRCDVRVPADVEAAIEAVCSRHGGLDLLVNNAGGVGAANYPTASFDSWRAILDLNLTGPMLATQLALEPMRARGGGAVVNIASSAGIGLAPYGSPEYGAAKAGLIRFTSTVASLRGTMNVRVNCVVPHWIGLERAHAEGRDLSPATTVIDSPAVFRFPGWRPWSPSNYGHNYAGAVTWRRALAESRNVAAVKVAAFAGLGNVASLWESASGTRLRHEGARPVFLSGFPRRLREGRRHG